MVKSLIPAERHQRIQALLETRLVASIADLSELLGVSEATIRRDLETLEERGLLERTHGGAILTRRLPNEPVYALSAAVHPEEKRRIGAAAAALVEEGDTVFINSGTTTTEVMRHLADRTDLGRATILTTNLGGVLDLHHPGLEVVLLGGSFRPESKAVVGEAALRALRQVYADKSFLGVDGFSLKCGLTTPVQAEAEIARLMLGRTRGAAVVVADSSKWGVVSNYEIGSLEQVRILVSDAGLSAGAVDELAAHGLRVVCADDDRSLALAAPLGAGLEDPNGHH
ncbi:MAG TPA: DeoR/GlpR family DNA-binding transcription regulator [Anaerolineales bacterium]|nr:DeoR/GlpR family DNA-binding transcription regulator [Anaerolineales bacterium]